MRWKKPEPRPATYWKPWFAWHPVMIEDTAEWVWLERIWRHIDRNGGGFGDIVIECRYRSDVHWAGANLERRGDGWPNLIKRC